MRGRAREDGVNAILLQGAAGSSEEPEAEQADSDTQGTHATRLPKGLIPAASREGKSLSGEKTLTNHLMVQY